MDEIVAQRIARPPFRVWRERVGLTRREAASLLGRTTRQIFYYEGGAEVPHSLMLAMAALEYLPSWRLAEFGIDPALWRKRRP